MPCKWPRRHTARIDRTSPIAFVRALLLNFQTQNTRNLKYKKLKIQETQNTETDFAFLLNYKIES